MIVSYLLIKSTYERYNFWGLDSLPSDFENFIEHCSPLRGTSVNQLNFCPEGRNRIAPGATYLLPGATFTLFSTMPIFHFKLDIF